MSFPDHKGFEEAGHSVSNRALPGHQYGATLVATWPADNDPEEDGFRLVGGRATG